jgi:predicted enzyme related to lactoylglutathione lyase
MSHVEKNQPEGTPTWIDLGIPDLDRAMDFYRALFGWEYEVGPAEAGHYTICLLDGRGVAALALNQDPGVDAFWWNVYFAADNCDQTSERVLAAGGELIMPPMDVMEQGRMAMARDPVGAQFGLWQGRNRIGAETVNEPGSLVRNDLITASPGPARDFYAKVFDFSLEGNPDLPDFDFTFLRRPDGHEIGGIMGVPDAPTSSWATTFEVADTDWTLEQTVAHGGQAGPAEDFIYGRLATITDPFGTEFSVIARPPGAPS